MRSFLFLLLQGASVVKSSTSFYPPAAGGGSNLDRATKNNLGEPLNVIISGESSPGVLNIMGLNNYMGSLGFGDECLGLHGGGYQYANLGDGNGWVKEIKVYREDYGDLKFGTCRETAIGGNHCRVWQQNGSKARSMAWFLAVSREEDLDHGHTITKDGYNLGRYELVQNATQLPTTRFGNTSYKTTVKYVQGLLKPGNEGVNHGISQDGRVAVLTVTIL